MFYTNEGLIIDKGNKYDSKCEKIQHKRGDGIFCKSLPWKHVYLAYKNLLKGQSWWLCSPLYPITRKVAAYLLINPPQEY